MRSAIPFLFLLCLTVKGYTQGSGEALSIKLNTNAVPVIIDYNSGFHAIFIDHKSLSYSRMGYDFSLESEGNVELIRMGYRAKIVEIAANRKNITLYSSRSDSSGLSVRLVNTINHRVIRKTAIKDWNDNTKLLGHFSVQDTTHFLISNEDRKLSYVRLSQGELISRNEFDLSEKTFNEWLETYQRWPQLAKHLVEQDHLLKDNHLPAAKVKFYPGHLRLTVSVDYGYKTHVIELNRKLNSLKEHTYDIEIPMSGSLSGSLSNSYISNGHIFQAVMTRGGCIVQKSDLKFQKLLYNKFISYQYSVQTSSPVFTLNRKRRGASTKTTDALLDYHGERTGRQMSLQVYKKGPFDHFYISEIEPLEYLPKWLERSNSLTPTNFTEKVDNYKMYLGLQFQQPSHFGFLLHAQSRSAGIGLTLDNTGATTPFLGDDDCPMAKASVYFHEIMNKGIRPLQSTMASINGRPYYCFYWKSKRLYQFLPMD